MLQEMKRFLILPRSWQLWEMTFTLSHEIQFDPHSQIRECNDLQKYYSYAAWSISQSVFNCFLRKWPLLSIMK